MADVGREQFGVFFGEQVWERGQALGLNGLDIVATMTAFTAASIAFWPASDRTSNSPVLTSIEMSANSPE